MQTGENYTPTPTFTYNGGSPYTRGEYVESGIRKLGNRYYGYFVFDLITNPNNVGGGTMDILFLPNTVTPTIQLEYRSSPTGNTFSETTNVSVIQGGLHLASTSISPSQRYRIVFYA